MERLFEPRRELGRTGFKASRIGAGDIADRQVPFDRCVATLRRTLDAGINVECVRYTLTVDPDMALLGMSFPNEQDAAFAAARDFLPMSREELAETRRRAAEAVEGKGHCWWDPQGT